MDDRPDPLPVPPRPTPKAYTRLLQRVASIALLGLGMLFLMPPVYFTVLATKGTRPFLECLRLDVLPLCAIPALMCFAGTWYFRRRLKSLPFLPKHGWSFSLRTLFVVVTLVAIVTSWVAYQLNWIRERQTIIAASQSISSRGTGNKISVCRNGFVNAPWSLRLFGEEGESDFYVARHEPHPEIIRLRKLFPEARVYGKPDDEE